MIGAKMKFYALFNRQQELTGETDKVLQNGDWMSVWTIQTSEDKL